MRCRFCKKQIYQVSRPGADKSFWLSDDYGTHCPVYGFRAGKNMTHEPELLTDERTAQVLVTAFLIEMRLLNDGCSSEKEFCVEAMKLVSLIENISKGARSVPQCWIDMFEDPALRLKQGENT